MKQFFTRLAFLAILSGLLMPSANAVALPRASSTTEPDPATVKIAVADFMSLSKKEKKSLNNFI